MNSGAGAYWLDDECTWMNSGDSPDGSGDVLDWSLEAPVLTCGYYYYWDCGTAERV